MQQISLPAKLGHVYKEGYALKRLRGQKSAENPNFFLTAEGLRLERQIEDIGRQIFDIFQAMEREILCR